MLRVTLLGPVTADLDGAAVRLGGRQQRAVFALLALGGGRPVSLDRMVHEVWQDEPPAGSTISLQSYISRLRRNLTDAASGRAGVPVPKIVTRPPGWFLEVVPDQIDLLQFERLAALGAACLERGEVASGAAHLSDAIALFSGEPLADIDLPFALGEAERIRALKVEVEENLLWAHLDSGRLQGVVEAARAFTIENPFRERGWCALMLALYRQGRQAEALEAADHLRRTLAEGLGLDPSPATRRLHEQVLRQDEALDTVLAGPAGAVAVPAETPSDPPTTAPGEPATILVGREDTMASLDDLIGRATAGEGGFVVVGGPAGIGKSALLDALQARMQSAGGQVLRGGGVSEQAMPALWPWVAILRQLVAATPGLGRASGDEAAIALSLLDPSVGTGAAGLPAHQDPLLARTRLYRAVVDLLESAHRAQPLALLIDDAHWLDPDTLGLLTIVADELVPQGVVVGVALRFDESPDLTAAIDSIAARHRQRMLRLVLRGLDVLDVRELLRHSQLPHPELDLATALVSRTGGNPLFVWELVRLLTSERRTDADAVYRFLPSHVRDVLRRRLDRLPDQTQALLTVVALINQGTGVGVLVAVTGMTEDAVLDAAEAAVASSLLVEDPGSGEFELSHDLVRQTLEELLSTSRKARLHARIAAAMQAEEELAPSVLPERVVEIARHLTLAESVVGADAAIPYLVAVADDARRRSAFTLTERALRAALDLAGRIENPVRRATVEFELRLRLTLQSNLVSGPPGSPMFGDQTALGVPIPSADVVTDPVSWWGQQIVRLTDGQVVAALAASEQAMTVHLPVATQAMVHSTAGLCHFIMGHTDLADEHLGLAEALETRGVDSPETLEPWVVNMLVSAPTIRAGAAVVAENWAAADEHVARARALAGTSPNELVLVEYHSAWRAAQEGDAVLARERAMATLALTGKLGDSFYAPMSRVILGWATAMMGDAASVRIAEEGCAACAAIGMRFQETVHLMLCAEAHAQHGDHHAARAFVLRSRASAVSLHERTIGRRLLTLGVELAGQE